MSPASLVTAGCAFLLTACWRVLTFSGFQNDHYVHLARAQQVMLGDLPVRDFVDPGLPLMYLASAAAWAIGGGSPGAELLLVAAGFAAGAALTTLVVHRLTGSLFLAIGAAVVEAVMAPRTYSYPKILLYAAAACAIVAIAEAPSRGRVLLAAAITAIAFLFRHDHGVYIGITLTVALLLSASGSSWQNAARRIALFAGAIALLCAPWLGFVAYHQGLVDYIASGLDFSRAESERNRGPLSFPPLVLTTSEFVSLDPPFRPRARIEWAADVSDPARSEIEERYGLKPADPGTSGSERDYHARRLSEDEVRALAEDPRVEDAQGLDRFRDWTDQDARRARFAPTRLRVGPGASVPGNEYVWLLYVFHLLPFACVATAWRRRRSHPESFEWKSISALAVLAMLVNVGLLRGSLPVWLPDGVAVPAILGAWLAAVAWRSNATSRVGRALLRVVVVVLAVMTLAAVSRAGDLESQIDRSGIGSDVGARVATLSTELRSTHRAAGNTPSGVSNALLPFFEYLSRCTTRDDRLLMSELYPDVFVLAERGFAAGHVAFLEGFYMSEKDQQLALARLRAESVPFVLIVRSSEEAFRDNFNLVQAFIAGQYRLMTEFPVEDTDAVRVYVDTLRTPRATDSATGWPCFQ